MLLEEMTDVSLRARFSWHWRPIAAITAVLVLLSAFLLRGPIGLGNGPLSAGVLATVQDGVVLGQQQREAIIIPVFNAGHAPAVIDSVQFKGGQGFPTPHTISYWTISYPDCASLWPIAANPGPPELPGECGSRTLGPLIGHRFRYQQRPGPFGLAEARPPGPNGCWVTTAMVVHYRVGIRRYAAADPFGLSFCGARATQALQHAAEQAASAG